MESLMYNRLLLLPLFTGLTTGELTQILAHIHMDFLQYEKGDIIAAQEDRCDRLIYVLNGKVRTECIDPQHKFILRELFDKPFLIEPYNMYGMTQNFEHTYTAEGKTNTVTISKQEFHSIMLNYRIPRTNTMNLLCAKIHRTQSLLTEGEAATVESKIVQFLTRNLLTCNGSKQLQMRMEDLADYIKETRLNVSMALKRWKEQGLISQPHRAVIHIEEMGNLK